MAYTLPANAPRITVNGRSIAILAIEEGLPIGVYCSVKVVEDKGGWVNIGPTLCNIEKSQLLEVVQNSGDGMRGFMSWLTKQINTFLATINVGTTTPTGEPTTDDEAWAAIIAGVNAMKLEVVGGVLVLK